jgi:hypothetical protein
MKSARDLLLVVATSTLSHLGCAEPGRNAPLRSPTLDYGHPTPTTSDGQVVGVDRKAPGDTLAESATSGGLAPGWNVQDGRPAYDPARQVGGALDVQTLREHHDPRERAPKKKPAGAR